MTIRYLLDRNIVSEPLRPEPDERLLRHLREHENEMAIPAVVWHELRFGAERLPPSMKRTAIERYLADVWPQRYRYCRVTNRPRRGTPPIGPDWSPPVKDHLLPMAR